MIKPVLRAAAVPLAFFALALALLCQQARINGLTAEVADLRTQLGQATSPVKEESYRASVPGSAGQSLAQEQFAELLRLRGEVGVLRRQLADRQQAVPGKDTALAGGVPSEQIEQLRLRGQAACESLKALHDQLQASGSDPDALLQAIRTSGIHDHLLDAFQIERTSATEALKSSQLEPSFRDNLTGVVTDSNRKIKERLDGYLVGLDAQTESLQIMIGKLQLISGDERLRFVSDLELAVRGAENLVGRSP